MHTPLFELLSKILLTQSVILFFNCVSRKLYLVLGKLAPGSPMRETVKQNSRTTKTIIPQRDILMARSGSNIVVLNPSPPPSSSSIPRPL